MSNLSGLQTAINIPHEQEFELYHNALSLCSMKVRLCLAELDIPYLSHHIDLIETGAYANVRPSFTAINPGMTVPVLVHNGHPIYESHEQIRYAAKIAHDLDPDHAGLLPADPRLRAEMEIWIDNSSLTDDPLANSHLSAGNAVPGQTLPLFATMIEEIPYLSIFEGVRHHFDKRRPMMFALMKLMGLKALTRVAPLAKAFRRSHHDLQTHFDRLEQQLLVHNGPWLLGREFTLADVSWLVIFERLRQTDAIEVFANKMKRPACCAYWQALRERPSYAAAITDHEHAIVVRGTQRIRTAKASDAAMRQRLEAAP